MMNDNRDGSPTSDRAPLSVWSPAASFRNAPRHTNPGISEVPYKVICRIRPEVEHQSCLSVVGRTNVVLAPSKNGENSTEGSKESQHTFDHVYGPKASQQDVFKAFQVRGNFSFSLAHHCH
jgi:hypothetical protein